MKNTKILIFFFFLSTAFFSRCLAEVETQLWQTTKSEHFIAYSQEAPYGYVDELINNAENYYNGIVDDLGYRRFDFWSWDNRAKIYLYKDNTGYHSTGLAAEWSGAMVNIKKRTIITFVGQQGFFDSVLPHELTHIIFREFVGDKINLPLWIDEGVACSQEKSNLKERLKFAKNLVTEGVYISLSKLNAIQGATLVVPNVFYAESASLIIFLLEDYGRDKFLDFSRGLRDGGDWQETLQNTYGFKDLNDMESKWKEFILAH